MLDVVLTICAKRIFIAKPHGLASRFDEKESQADGPGTRWRGGLSICVPTIR